MREGDLLGVGFEDEDGDGVEGEVGESEGAVQVVGEGEVELFRGCYLDYVHSDYLCLFYKKGQWIRGNYTLLRTADFFGDCFRL